LAETLERRDVRRVRTSSTTTIANAFAAVQSPRAGRLPTTNNDDEAIGRRQLNRTTQVSEEVEEDDDDDDDDDDDEKTR